MMATRIPSRYSLEALPLGNPTRRTMPKNPRTNPKYPIHVNFSIRSSRPIIAEYKGMAPTKIAVIAVPIRGTAKDNPIS